jgi:hypothetical protein
MQQLKLIKIFVIIIVIFLIMIILHCYCQKFVPTKCESNDPKIISLYEANNELNDAYSRKDWEEIYYMESKIHTLGNKEDYIMDLKKIFFWGKVSLKMISYNIDRDTAETINLIKCKLIFFPFKTYTDTTFHYWQYKDERWYLFDWDRRDLPDIPPDPDFEEIDRKLEKMINDMEGN